MTNRLHKAAQVEPLCPRPQSARSYEARAAWAVDDPVICSLSRSSSSASSSGGSSIKRMPGSSPDVTMGEGTGMWHQDKLHGRFLEALVAVQSSGVRATGATVLQEMQRRGVREGSQQQVENHISDYCKVLLESGMLPLKDAGSVQRRVLVVAAQVCLRACVVCTCGQLCLTTSTLTL